jgi:hypothetical protein
MIREGGEGKQTSSDEEAVARRRRAAAAAEVESVSDLQRLQMMAVNRFQQRVSGIRHRRGLVWRVSVFFFVRQVQRDYEVIPSITWYHENICYRLYDQKVRGYDHHICVVAVSRPGILLDSLKLGQLAS